VFEVVERGDRHGPVVWMVQSTLSRRLAGSMPLVTG
jgi:hypothetical protein